MNNLFTKLLFIAVLILFFSCEFSPQLKEYMDKFTESTPKTNNQKIKSTLSSKESEQKYNLEKKLLKEKNSRTTKEETQQQVILKNVVSRDNNIEKNDDTDDTTEYSIHSEILRQARKQRQERERQERERQEIERNTSIKVNTVLIWARGKMKEAIKRLDFSPNRENHIQKIKEYWGKYGEWVNKEGHKSSLEVMKNKFLEGFSPIIIEANNDNKNRIMRIG
ncbi:hypothetical protein F0310_04215 [Borrelia sp. A-FGy1]|uniref:hypothetical protein n=1 Tax=Borrelia sp. A-FGy1 TaxID=2608247 RepID=UPI0015F6E8B4|nr:hypothetical protein [Borrelia sp. A-FGy1]QMU99585.1 hypothetical protein F0310_04215 [Borrelia sp. A-FGy1]